MCLNYCWKDGRWQRWNRALCLYEHLQASAPPTHLSAREVDSRVCLQLAVACTQAVINASVQSSLFFALCLSAQPGFQCHAVQDGPRSLAAPQPASNPNHTHHPTYTALPPSHGHHTHQPAQCRTHSPTLLRQVQHAHIAR